MARRTLVLFPGALGDFICFLPALEFLAARSPLDLLSRSEFADLTPARVRVQALECYGIHRLFVPGAVEDKQLVELFRSYSSIHSWTGSGHADFVRFLHQICGPRARVYPARPDDASTAQIDYYLSCLGVSRNFRIPRIVPRAESMAWSHAYWMQSGLENKPVLVMAPGSGATEKNWPVSFYHDVALWWRRRTGGVVVVILGPVEEERGSWDSLYDGNVVARKRSLGQVAALLMRSRLYLGNDSGMTHLAAALGIRTVAVFGPSSIRQWRPVGERVTVVSQNVDCSPCSVTVMKSCAHRQCLTRLGAGKIIDILEGLPEVSALTRGGVEFRLPSEFLP